MNKGKAKVVAVPVTPTPRPFQYLARQPEQKAYVPAKYTGRQPDVIPMDIDRTNKMRDGLCFNCDQKGHLARNCPHPCKPQKEGDKPRRAPLVRSVAADMDPEEFKAYVLDNWTRVSKIIAQDGEPEGQDFGDHQ